ncbi:hypothetical protein MRX96_037406 [Rhipicephalus microplus]
MPALEMPAVQKSVQQTPAPAVPTQQTSGQQTTTGLAVTEVPSSLTPTFYLIIEHDQEKLSRIRSPKVTTLDLPAGGHTQTDDSIPAKPASLVAPKKSMTQAEAKKSKLGGSTESHVITLPEKWYTFLLQSLNLPIHSKPIISILHDKVAKPLCKCLSGQQSQTPQQTGPQQTIALQTPALQMRSLHMSLQQRLLRVVPTADTGAANNHRAGGDRSGDTSDAHVLLDH